MTREEVFTIFKDFFGEDRVDLRTDTIITHWPKVTVSNEAGKSIEIWDVFNKIQVTNDGRLSGQLQWIRSSYDVKQWCGGYEHSHIPSRSNAANFFQWSGCCTGSGPIVNSMSRLKYSNVDELNWRMFCYELDKYIHVESTLGGPYYRMADLENGARSTSLMPVELCNDVTSSFITTPVKKFNTIFKDSLKSDIPAINQFIAYILQSGKLKYSFIDGTYGYTYNQYELIKCIGDLFIEWYNKLVKEYSLPDSIKSRLVTEKLLISLKASGGVLFRIDDTGYNNRSIEEFHAHLGRTVLIFKEKPIPLKCIGSTSQRDNSISTIQALNVYIVSYICTKILKILNSLSKDVKEETKTNGTATASKNIIIW